ncbi:MAG: 23S rRNA (pseudouridine(1915)-N(3))-methyltransferase RlmH [Salinisphaera sp.]|nr:23S rRNA (pseudouridine(1915)-N(3))-methyltransferase RlmH [Salinisphaera sp.]
MPAWVDAGYDNYARRMPREAQLRLREVALGRRRNNDPAQAVAEEGRRMLAMVPAGAQLIALAVDGSPWSTAALAARMAAWMADGRDRALLVGGPDGLSADCLARAELRWSLSPLTLPHGLVRVLTAEALYRAWTVLARHPYHRG